MIDFAPLRRKLEDYGVATVREMLSAGRFQPDKRSYIEAWLEMKAAEPTTVRPTPRHGKRYTPSGGDLAYRDAAKGELSPFDEARLLRRVSHEYLAVLASDNTGPSSAGFKAMVDAELARRGSAIAMRANWIAAGALVVSMAALAVSLF